MILGSNEKLQQELEYTLIVTAGEFGPSCMNQASVFEWHKRFKEGTLRISQWHFHQDNAPVHNSILVTDVLTKMA